MQMVGRGGRIQLLKFSLHRNQEPNKQRSAMSTDRNNTDKSTINILIMVNRKNENQSKTNILMVNRQT